MELKALNGHSLVFEIVGYQFPAETGDSLNWLMVRTTARVPGKGEWSVTDPSLETHELHWLANWLDAVAEQRIPEQRRELNFTEPNLAFGVSQTSLGKTCLRVYFALESRPPWAPCQTTYDRDVYVEFPLDEIDVQRFSRWIREQLVRFPPREPEDP
jgi:hypothetical protein